MRHCHIGRLHYLHYYYSREIELNEADSTNAPANPVECRSHLAEAAVRFAIDNRIIVPGVPIRAKFALRWFKYHRVRERFSFFCCHTNARRQRRCACTHADPPRESRHNIKPPKIYDYVALLCADASECRPICWGKKKNLFITVIGSTHEKAGRKEKIVRMD